MLQSHRECKRSPVRLLLLLINFIKQDTGPRSVTKPTTRHFIHSGRRSIVTRSVSNSQPHIPLNSLSSIFPLYHPYSVDILIFWENTSKKRSGHVLVPGLTVGSSHGLFRGIIAEAESSKAIRSMYAETRREKMEILQAVRDSDWNNEMDPLTVTLEFVDSVSHDFARGFVSWTFVRPVSLTDYLSDLALQRSSSNCAITRSLVKCNLS
jgi:hypothetical protein